MSNIVNAGNNTKSFWDKKEGKTGLIFIGIISLVSFVIFGNVILPFVIAALQNTLHTIMLGALVLAIVTLAMDKKVQFLIQNIFKSSMRAITSIFITIDPIGILKNYIDLMVKKITGIELNISKLSGQKRNIYETIERAKEDKEEALNLASSAKKQNKKEESILYSRKAARAEVSIKKFTQLYERMELMYNHLDKMKKAVSLLLEDTKDEVRVKEIEYKAIKSAHKAMSSAQDLINGSSERELYEQSLEYLAEDLGVMLGEMDRLLDLSNNFMSGVDIQNGAWDEKGLKMLEVWESESIIIDYEKSRENKKLYGNTSSVTVINTTSPVTVSNKKSNMDYFFKK